MSPCEDYQVYYDLEAYLFDVVSSRFRQHGYLSAFDFFCIVIWKANRAKSKVAKRILCHAEVSSLEDGVRRLTKEIAGTTSSRARLELLTEKWGFRLPMASAILTVLFPEEFTVYDYRVREQVGCRDLSNLSFETMWPQYLAYRQWVLDHAPEGLSLRQADRFFSGKSIHDQLKADLQRCFSIY